MITGATAGVGRAVARRFARQGAKLAMLASKRDELTSAAIEVVTLGASAALAIPCDIDNEAQLDAATQRIEQELGPIDVWIDIAGGQRARNRLAIAAGAAAALVGFVGLTLLLRRAFR